MRTLFIPKGFHRPLSLIPPFLRKPEISDDYISIEKRVIFPDSCRYGLDNGDQDDWNKLFGFCFGVLGIHRNSARVAWRYVPESDHVELSLYTYINGERDYYICYNVPVNSICKVNLLYDRKEKRMILFVEGKFYSSVRKEVSFPDKPVFGCGLYFGGNRRAPHNIKIYEY